MNETKEVRKMWFASDQLALPGKRPKLNGTMNFVQPNWATPLTRLGPILVIYITQVVGGTSTTPRRFARSDINTILFGQPYSFAECVCRSRASHAFARRAAWHVLPFFWLRGPQRRLVG